MLVAFLLGWETIPWTLCTSFFIHWQAFCMLTTFCWFTPWVAYAWAQVQYLSKLIISLDRELSHQHPTINACEHACMQVCVYVCMHTCTHACMHVCVRVCLWGRNRPGATWWPQPSLHMRNYNSTMKSSYTKQTLQKKLYRTTSWKPPGPISSRP